MTSFSALKSRPKHLVTERGRLRSSRRSTHRVSPPGNVVIQFLVFLASFLFWPVRASTLDLSSRVCHTIFLGP
jgi:hypothetical protein